MESNKISSPQTAKRIWELDFIRGVCVLLMIFDHFMFDLGFIFGDIWHSGGIDGSLHALSMFASNYYWTSILRTVVRTMVLASFIGLCGLSCSFSRSNLWRGLRLLAVALLLSLVTWSMDKIMGQHEIYTIRFGILHMLAFSILIYSLIRPLGRGTAMALGIMLVGLGIYFHYYPPAATGLIPGSLGINSIGFFSADYFPLLPWCGYFLIGAAIGSNLYPERKSYFPQHGQEKMLKPFLFMGKHALLFYILHQPIVYGILWLFTLIIL